MPLRGSVSSSLAQTGSFGRMQGRRRLLQKPEDQQARKDDSEALHKADDSKGLRQPIELEILKRT